MATSLVSLSAERPDERPRQLVELNSDAGTRRFDFRLRRSAVGVEFVGLCLPAPRGLELEICADDQRIVASVPANGRVRIPGIARTSRHVTVFVRGGGLPALAFLKLPVT